MKEGQKVVCVDDAAPPHVQEFYTSWIRKGTVYVIRGVFLGVDYQSASAGEVGVYLPRARIHLATLSSDRGPHRPRGERGRGGGLEHCRICCYGGNACGPIRQF
jgi:hypothetical protein